MRTDYRRWLTGLAGFVVPLIVAGCGGASGIHIAEGSRAVGVEDALALPPPGGPAVLDVIQKRYGNAVAQKIHLVTNAQIPGQNELDVAYFGPVAGGDANGSPAVDRRLTGGSVTAEMRGEFPGVAMQRSPYYVQNAYGPFGYAVGRLGADTCFYGWQRIRAREDAPRLFASRGTIQVRLRLCRTGASEAELLSVMYGYTLIGFFDEDSWNPFGTVPAPSPDLGTNGRLLYPASPAGAAGVLPEPTPQPAPDAGPQRRDNRVPRTARVVARPLPPPLPAPIGPAVPLPPGAPPPASMTAPRQAAPAPSAAMPAGAAPAVPMPQVPAPGDGVNPAMTKTPS